jgi:glycolate oxidase FAD binding subunit
MAGEIAATLGASDCQAKPPGSGPSTQERTAGKGALNVEITVLRTQVPSVVNAIEREVPGGVFDPISPALGQLGGVWILEPENEENTVSRLQRIVAALGGTMVVKDCSLELKQRIDVFGDPPPSFPLMRRIKEQFDPNGILSPGRFVGRL